jgi:uncharacterized membrane protein
MNRVLRVVSVILMAIGLVWLFQGIGVLPGSFMTGQTRWAVYGCLTAVAGLVLWVTSRRRL